MERDGDLLLSTFPSRPPSECTIHPGLHAALGATPKLTLAARDYLCVYETEEQVRALAPDMRALAAMDRFAVIVTAPGSDCDFVSRFFAPAKGVDEDPLTGSAHCTLIPYWSKRLGKTEISACAPDFAARWRFSPLPRLGRPRAHGGQSRQISRRGTSIFEAPRLEALAALKSAFRGRASPFSSPAW